jgi:hypothetical protein
MFFDLNIKNYSKDELKEMFELPDDYDKKIIEINENKLRQNIINSKDIDKDFQIKVMNFLIEAKKLLLENIEQETINNHELVQTINNSLGSSYKSVPIRLESDTEHMVQEKYDPPPYQNSLPSQYFKGIFNPLKRKTREENLVIDTRFRENYYNSSPTNFNFQLPLFIQNVLSMKLTAIELPTTYYVISKQYNNNFFTLTVNSNSTVINIPDGNYDNESFITCLNNQIILAGGDFKYVTFVINIYNNNTGSGQMIVGLDENAPSDLEFELNFQADRFGYDDRSTPLPLKLGWIMGFRNGIYINNKNYVSEGIVDLAGPRYFYLVIDDFNNNNNNGLFYSAFNSSILNKNILARISLQSGLFKIILQDGLNIISSARDYFGPVNISNFQIQLLDEYGRVVDLNYMDFSFCLTLAIAYDI